MIFKRLLFQNRVQTLFVRSLYIQGQSPEPKVREYFYFIDHQGMVRTFGFFVKSLNVFLYTRLVKK